MDLVPTTDPNWQTILHHSNQVVLYNPTSHALAIHRAPLPAICPYCQRSLDPGTDESSSGAAAAARSRVSDSRAPNYFQLLAEANEMSRPPSPDGGGGSTSGGVSAESMAEGYFNTFFREECRLGMGANGSVFLCQHVLDGNPLGHFAVKKIAVGESHSYLLKILHEVRLLESLRHPNIITYHHAWLETSQFSSFGPKVPTLHVLMQWAEGGSLDDFIDARQGRPGHGSNVDPANDTDSRSRSARIRAFRALQRAPPEDRRREMDGERTWKAVHLLSAPEVRSLFGDVVEGLWFLHDKSILHLDLKPGNVLLTWDEGRLVPRAMLSDFGTSRDMIHSPLTRTGNTGTLEYAAPELLPSPRTGLLKQVDSKADMWSLGMILHKLLFLKLPYRYATDMSGDADGDVEKMNRLEREVVTYSGFKSTPQLAKQFEGRRLPRAFLVLLEGLLNVVPSSRPSCERVSSAIREGMLDPVEVEPGSTAILVRRLSDGSGLTPTPAPSAPASADEGGGGGGSAGDDGETRRVLLLGLPAPTTRVDERRQYVRAIKAIVLVAKILSMYVMACPGNSRWSWMVVVVLTVMGVADVTLFEGEGQMAISVGLSVAHLAVLSSGFIISAPMYP